jgi:uncharacterized RDD family membrane protein YckC/predicted nucleic acid-binding Zn ribbon protein
MNQASNQFCDQCKSKLSNEVHKHQVCPVCLTSYEKGDVFCEKDGSRLIEFSELSYRCCKCGKLYAEDVQFCPDDGGKITNMANHIPAPLGKRFGAAILDGLIVLGLSLPTLTCILFGVLALQHRNREMIGLLLLLAGLVLNIIPLVYTLFKDGMGKGQSWGKRALKLQVLHENLSKSCSYKKSFVRNGVMVLLNFIPFVGALIEPIVLFASDNGKRLGDRAAKTLVVEIENKSFTNEV